MLTAGIYSQILARILASIQGGNKMPPLLPLTTSNVSPVVNDRNYDNSMKLALLGIKYTIY